MCGIAGIVSSDQKLQVSEEVFLKMRDMLAHRGPDDAGMFTEPGVLLGARRLSILDLSERGHMPMRTRDGRFTIVYNGETFNFKSLRQELISRGCQFQSDTDTEVVLNLYALEGPRMLNRLNGMFAIAIWDSRERTLFLARDPLGIKPLYYRTELKTLSFASEAKAFSALGSSLQFDQEVMEELLCFRFVAGEGTCFKNIKKLLPGHYLIWKEGEVKVNRWWHLGERMQDSLPPAIEKAEEAFWELFDDAVKIRTISDVPLGVFLSGGLDSNLIAASLAGQINEPVKTFMIRFRDPQYDEGILAHTMVKKWGFDHHEIFGEVPDLLSELKQSSWLNDEPLAHGNDFYFYILSRYAKSKATVLLSGEGADEILGGYMRYLPLQYPNLLKFLRPWFPALKPLFGKAPRMKKLADFLKIKNLDDFILYNSCNVLPYQLEFLGIKSKGAPLFRQAMLEEAKRYYKEPIRQAMYLDQHTFLCSLLDRNDRMTMGASVECRPPFLDTRIIERVARMPTDMLFQNGRGKSILRSSMRKRIPREVLQYRKWGFGVPWGQFLRADVKLRERLIEIPNREPFLSGPLDRVKLKGVIEKFFKGTNEHYALILELLMISIWYEVFFDEKKSGDFSTAA